MSTEANEIYPFVAECMFCVNGLIGFWRCPQCTNIVGHCQECGLMWPDIEELQAFEGGVTPSSKFPVCPTCRKDTTDGYFLNMAKIHEAGLQHLVSPEYERMRSAD